MDHEYMDYYTFLSFDVCDRLQDLSDKDTEKKQQLLAAAHTIVTYFMTHSAEVYACDFLMEIERMDLLHNYVNAETYQIVCLYLSCCAVDRTHPENCSALKVAVELFIKFHQFLYLSDLQLHDQKFIKKLFLQHSTQMSKLISLEDYIKAGALLGSGIVKSMREEKYFMPSHLYRPVQHFDSFPSCKRVRESRAALSSVNLNFAGAALTEVFEQTYTELCMPVQVQASCSVQVDSKEFLLPKVTEAVKTHSPVKSELTSTVPSEESTLPCPTLTLSEEPYQDQVCQGQSAVSPYSQTKVGSRPNINCGYPTQLKFQSHAQGGGDRSSLGGQVTHNLAWAAAYAKYGDKPGQQLQIADFGYPGKIELVPDQLGYPNIFHGHPLRNVVPSSLVTGNDPSSENRSPWTVPDLFADFWSQIDRLAPHVRFKYDWNCPPRLPLFKSAIGKSMWNRENTDDLLVDVLWPD